MRKVSRGHFAWCKQTKIYCITVSHKIDMNVINTVFKSDGMNKVFQDFVPEIWVE